MLQPRLVEWVTEAASAGCETGILTNGLLLTREKADELIKAGLDWICVSMDGADKDEYEKIRVGSDFERVCNNLENIAKLRRGKKPKTMINFVLMRINLHQVHQIVGLAYKLGVDQVNFKQCDVVRGEHGKGLGLFGPKPTGETRTTEKNLRKALSLARKKGIKTTSFPFTPGERPVCEQDPRDSIFIRYDGVAAPCINLANGGPTTFLGDDVVMPVVHYGRITERDILDLWDSVPCTFYRKRFRDRVQRYEDTFFKSLIGGSPPAHHRLLELAIAAMPEAPQGCKVCHYLYDL